MTDDRSDVGLAPSVAPTLTLSRGGLLLSMLGMIAVGLGVYAIFPESVGGPPLPVTVQLDKQPVEVPGGGGAVMTEVVILRNDSDHAIPRITLDINGQYLLFREAALAKGESLTLPQRVFTDKRSSARFDPDNYEVEEIVVTGQLPTGARGISKFEFAAKPNDESSSESE